MEVLRPFLLKGVSEALGLLNPRLTAALEGLASH